MIDKENKIVITNEEITKATVLKENTKWTLAS